MLHRNNSKKYLGQTCIDSYFGLGAGTSIYTIRMNNGQAQALERLTEAFHVWLQCAQMFIEPFEPLILVNVPRMESLEGSPRIPRPRILGRADSYAAVWPCTQSPIPALRLSVPQPLEIFRR